MNKSFISKLRPVALGASMADLAMLLLVFFMTATSTEPPPGVEVELPTSVTQGADQDSIYITVSNRNRIFYDGSFVTPDQLQDALQIRAMEKDRVVAVTADKNLTYREISLLLKILRENDFLNVVFMSQPRVDTDD